MFDGIPGYPKGYRILTNFFGGTRQNMTLGFPPHLTKVELSNAFLERYRQAIASPIPYRVVDGGPVLENVLNGDDVNVLKFPTPKWHDGDGGRYIGTGSFNVTMDPESDWINVGTAWLSDGGYLVVNTSSSLLLLDVRTGETRTLLADHPTPNPGYVKVGPDDSAIYYLSGSNEADIWLATMQ